MENMFYGSLFTGDISAWDVSNVKNMRNMFMNSVFNSDVSKWCVSKAVNLNGMFSGSQFKRDISSWAIHGDAIVWHTNMFSNNSDGLKAQSMRPWIIQMYLTCGLLPDESIQRDVFESVRSVATALNLNTVEHAQFIYERLMQRSMDACLTYPFESL